MNSKIRFAIALCLGTLVFAPSSPLYAQGSFYGTSINVTTANPTSCTNTMVDVNTWLGCINWTQGPSSFTVSGDTIRIDVNYTSSFICAGAISQPVFSVNLGQLPANTYTLFGDAYLDNAYVNTVNGSLTVAACTTTFIRENVLSESNWNVFPNPSSGDQLFIQSTEEFQGQVIYRLTDINGKEVQDGLLNLSQQPTKLPFDHLPSGLYLLNLQSGEELSIRKITIK